MKVKAASSVRVPVNLEPSFAEILKRKIPLPADAPRGQKIKQKSPQDTQPTKTKMVQAPSSKPDRTPQRRKSAQYQRRKAKAKEMLLAGTCKPSVRGIGSAIPCNNMCSSSIIADLVDEGILIRESTGKVSLVA